MQKDTASCDPHIGLKIGHYQIIGIIGEGKCGKVYKAIDTRVNAIRACKFIRELRDGWENEITKVTQLQGVPHVVGYIEHDVIEVNSESEVCIQWNYVKGTNLRELIENHQISMNLLADVVSAVLTVLTACQKRNIQHNDLHAGNILIQDPNEVEPQRIWITDFGYCTSSMGKELLDDFVGLSSIIDQSISAVEFNNLDAAQKGIYRCLKYNYLKQLHETSPVESL